MKTNGFLKQTVGLAAILIASLAPLHAATTNSVQNILFELTFFAQGPTNQPSTDITQVSINKFRVTTRDIIAALGQATSNSFSSAARLVSVQDATSNGSERKIQVRDLGNIVDVTSFFKLAAVETNLLSVHSLVVNRATGIGTGMTDGIFHLTLTNANLATASTWAVSPPPRSPASNPAARC